VPCSTNRRRRIEAAGLGWSVAKEPIAVDRGDKPTDEWWVPRCEEIPGFYATVRQDTREVLGIVGERYRLVQNHEAFTFIDQLLGSSIHFETAGSLHGGRRVWVLATLPDHVEVGGDDVCPYVLLMNSHDGSTAVIAATTPIRVVCQNTLNWGLANARQKFSIRHTEAVTQRVPEARRVLDLSISYYEQFKCFGDQLASERCSERQLRSILDELYPSGTSDSVWSHPQIAPADEGPHRRAVHTRRHAGQRARLQVDRRERDRGVRRLAAPAALERPALRPRSRRRTR
jgi:phage/plasmid-like protein (TIGR03299 family)